VTTAVPPAQPGSSQQAVIDAALLLLRQMGLSPADLTAAPHDPPVVPTFAEYVPVVAATVSAGAGAPTARTGTGSPGTGAPGAWTSPRRGRSSS
jgi:hypothetical protein